jgi:hypothetical protein
MEWWSHGLHDRDHHEQLNQRELMAHSCSPNTDATFSRVPISIHVCWAKLPSMKGLSVIFILVLLVLAHHLAQRLKRSGALPVAPEAISGVSALAPASAASGTVAPAPTFLEF